MQMDSVEDMVETDPLSAHLDVMFPPDGQAQAPNWDAAHAYKRHVLQLYYLSYAAQPLLLAKLTEVRAMHKRVAEAGMHAVLPQSDVII